MRVLLVTGGCGFIGSHFVRLVLARTDWRVVNLDKLTYAGDEERLTDVRAVPRYHFVRGDIADRDLLDRVFGEERPWGIVNFAAESHVDRSILDAAPFLHTNIIGVQALLEAARTHRIERFVQISTDEVYGDAHGRDPFREDSPLLPSSPYAASKAAADLLCLASLRTHGLPVLILRSSNNYGPFQFPEKLIPLMIRNALAGEELPVYGDGQQRRDWFFVEDNVQGILRGVEQGRTGAIYNLSGGQERTNLEVVRDLCRLMAEESGLDRERLHRLIRSVADRPGHDRRYAVRTERMQRELGWRPTTTFEQGLRRTVRWYLEHRDWMRNVESDDYRRYYDAVYRGAWEQRS